MGKETEKRNTDCVYFLASPLTCKKGSECEYRHSESARLNPRDCWYWMNITCLNPSCAFRHPPLGLTQTLPEPSQPPSNPSIPTSKVNVPCYFYFTAYCIKGDQCPFLHETAHAQNFPKPAHETTIAYHVPENKASSGSDTGPTSIEMPPNPPGSTLEPITQDQTIEEPSSSIESLAPDLEESGVKLVEENLLPPMEEYTNACPLLHPDECADEMSKLSADEWWESSPGFDVLVDNVSEQLAYEEGADYLFDQERESEMSEMLHFDYEAPPGYDPLAYPDASYLYDHGVYENFNRTDNQLTSEFFPRVSKDFPWVSKHSSERRDLEPKSHRKRKPSRRKHEDVSDLRHHLQKLRRTSGSLWKHHVSQIRCSNHERPERQGIVPPLFGGRLVFEVDSNMHHVSRYLQFTRHARSRHREWEDRSNRRNQPFISSEILGPSVSRRSESTEIKSSVATFSGPKTLLQIKEEKRRTKVPYGNSSCGHIPQNLSRQGFKDFEGPKPLSELLKDKRRSVIASVQEHCASGDGGILLRAGYESDFVEDGDEDAIRE